jgi:hypothetical protein
VKYIDPSDPEYVQVAKAEAEVRVTGGHGERGPYEPSAKFSP